MRILYLILGVAISAAVPLFFLWLGVKFAEKIDKKNKLL